MRTPARESRTVGIITSAATYIVAFAVSVLAVNALPLEHPLARLGAGTAVATVIVFAASVLADNSSMYDPYWSLQPLAIAAVYAWWSWPAPGVRETLVLVLILAYAVRLTGNFYRGWKGLSQEDFRYRNLRGRFGGAYWGVSLLGIHVFPTLVVWMGCLPLFVIMRTGARGVGWLDGLATAVYIGALVLAFVADGELWRFRKDPGNHGRPMRRGLWSFSRHPNYLGEIAAWWALWLFALSSGLEYWWTGIGALSITLMFVYVSVPMMEAHAAASRTGYERYREETPMLLPIPRKKKV